jgi:putative hydrolase of the HAD superfamily
MTPSVLYCDFGGVLTPPVADAFQAVARAAAVAPARLRAAMAKVASDLGLEKSTEPLELGMISQHDWGRKVTAALGTDAVPQVPLTDFGDYWYDGREINAPLLARLHALRTRGIRIGMLTNSVAEWEPHRARMLGKDSELFEVRMNSHELGVRKPDQKIFELAEHAMSALPADCLLIDDLAVNCDAARQRGWHAVEHHSTMDTLDQLDALFSQR